MAKGIPSVSSDRSLDRSIREYALTFPGLDTQGISAHLAVVRAFAAIDEVLNEFLQPYGLNRTRYTILRVLLTSPEGKMTMNEIRSRMRTVSTNVTRMVEVLAQDGAVQRETAPNDRRVVHVSLTPKGEELAHTVVPRVGELCNSMWSPFSADEHSELVELLARFRVHMEAHHLHINDGALLAAGAAGGH